MCTCHRIFFFFNIPGIPQYRQKKIPIPGNGGKRPQFVDERPKQVDQASEQK